MGRMADLDAELHELPDEAKDFMQGFYRGRAEGLAMGQEEGAIMERERIISLLQERGLKLGKEVMYGDGWAYGRHEEIVFVTKLIEGENN